MKRTVSFFIWLCLPPIAFAIPITLFWNTDMYIKRAHDIVVARCVSIPEGGPEEHQDMLYPAEVDIIKILKGSRQIGRDRVATIYPMEVGGVYLLGNSGGLAHGTDFLAVSELAVVPLPANLDVGGLDGKELKEQVQYIFSRHLREVENDLEPLLKERALLEKAVSDRQYERYESHGPIKIGPIVETRTGTDPDRPGAGIKVLQLDGEKLESSVAGFLYFENVGPMPRIPYWEFAPSEAAKVEDLVGQPLQARFYNMYSPGRAEVGWGGLQSIRVSSGTVLLARTTDDLRRIFVIQIVRVAPGITVRYATIQNE